MALPPSCEAELAPTRSTCIQTDRSVYSVAMSPRIYASARNRILDAAERVILRDGLGGLNVDAVVRESEGSKGGFFHHFASKEELLASLTERLAEGVAARIEEMVAQDPDARGSHLRAQVLLAFDMSPAERSRLRALVLALVAAAMEGKGVAARARKANNDALAAVVGEGGSFGRALVVQVALDGYWLAESVGTLKLDAEQKKAFRDTLLELTEPAKPAKKGRKR